MIRLFHDHLHSSRGVMVEDFPVPLSMFLLSSSEFDVNLAELASGFGNTNSSSITQQNHVSHDHISVSSSLKHSRIVSLEVLHSFLEAASNSESKNSVKPAPAPVGQRGTSALSFAESSAYVAPVGTGFNPRHVTSLSISQYMSYDFTHSCYECAKYVRGNFMSNAEILTFNLPGRTSGEKAVQIQWCVPANQQKHCVISGNRKILERLKLPAMKLKGDKMSSYPLTPIFTPTLGRDSSGLFNLFHNQFYVYQIHVLVTSESDFGKYCKAWPNHLIMALPDKEATGLGKY